MFVLRCSLTHEVFAVDQAKKEEKEKLEGRMNRLKDTEKWQQMVVVLERAIVWTGVNQMETYVAGKRELLGELPGAVAKVWGCSSRLKCCFLHD